MEESSVALTEEQLKQQFISKYFNDEKLLDKASEEDLKLYKEYISEGIKKKWMIALYALAYGCYGGNQVFKCDWERSRDTLLEIIDIQGDEDPFIYNTLGYIYYYGRCNNKQPEYDLAFKYFSVGAANGVFESVYKLADMFISGKGVPKSEKSGAKLIISIYDENQLNFCNEIYDCKFADVALRVGGLYEQGIGVVQDYVEAFYYYCEARYAIKKRMEVVDFFGDEKVLSSIDEAYERVKDKLPEDFLKNELVFDTPSIIGMLLSTSMALDVELLREGNDYYLKVERYASEDMERYTLINIPEKEYCELTNVVKIKLKNAIVVDFEELPKRAFIDSIRRSSEEDNTWIFSYRDMELLKVTCDGFIF